MSSTSTSTLTTASSTSASTSAIAKSSSSSCATTASASTNKKSAIKTEAISMTYKFRCRPQNMFEAFTDERLISSYVQAKCQADPKAGGRFSFFGGSLTGTFTELNKPNKIVETWRFSEWPEDHSSIVELNFKEIRDSVTQVDMSQTGIPLEDRYGNHDIPEKVSKGWRNYFFERIEKVLGYSLAKDDDDD
eukprot:TRINITY_DN350_c0_g1_i1.p1 TRINITY_DN350_c0_g1~~TRINITY_DN350_c0_g1_i1.p1  ORF type:complete len:191 (-),score=34.81 TRINITY_DN350_c0_g1_i1:217-789(-)